MIIQKSMELPNIANTFFFYEGINTDLFFEIPDERLCFNSLMPKKEEYYDIDDSKTAWFFKLHKNKIIFDYHFECQKNE
jgi:hypothetical protein